MRMRENEKHNNFKVVQIKINILAKIKKTSAEVWQKSVNLVLKSFIFFNLKKSSLSNILS